MRYSPILIFAYNRPDRLEALLASLAACPELDESPVSIFIDGPKGDHDRDSVLQVVEVAEALAPKHAVIRARDANLGLKQSIMTGVTDALQQNDRVIVLEDDLIVSPHLLTYFNAALRVYRDCERVWSITGYMFNVPELAVRDTSFFLPFPNPWAWATWSSRWEKFSRMRQPCDLPINASSFRTSFNAHGVRDFASILDLDRRELVSSWFINWYLAMFKDAGLTMWPPKPLVSNQGGADGTHATVLNLHRFLPRPPLSNEFLPEFPSDITVDYAALDMIRGSTDARLQRAVSVIGGIRRRIGNKLRI
ncbi:glycosyltransferase [Qipengyuania sp. 1XM1-15A]|uniref:glycosyltransferase n=1 Tax=Qipengyuania xiamenensis TaxID=2867237 RepID=UPI001C882E8C|nr:glycosyltransferase [Qipengyuania xiamenensis]MBX7531764.1 glycosyltransferase [Qipengyuania xiamenensis]